MSDKKTPAPGSFKFEIAKEIDKALADAVRGLLVKPAQAVGDLASNAIGIFGDSLGSSCKCNTHGP